MGLAGLLNKVCSWKRRINLGRNDYGEPDYTEQVIGSDVPCAIQTFAGLNRRRMIEEHPPGDFNKKIQLYWVFPTDIMEGDIFFSDTGASDHVDIAVVRDVRDAAGRGHHYDVLAELVEEIGEGDEIVAG